MKIAYLMTRSAPIGGVQIHVRDLAAALLAHGHCPTVVTAGGGPLIDDLRARGVPVIELRHLTVPIHPLRDLLACREIRAALLHLQPDVLALHSSKAGILGRVVGRWLGIPSVLTAHGWNFTPGIAPCLAAMYRQIERATGPLLTKIITVSEYDRRLAIEARVAPAHRVVAVYNGIPDVAPSLQADPSRTPVRLVMIARFGSQKDHPTLFRALAGIQHPTWELDLVGDGPLMEEMKRLASSLQLGSRVRFLGQRLDVPHILAEAQVGVLATNWEGFPLSILEAMRAGLPVVATAVAGVAESVRDGETGYLVPQGNVEVLRDRISRLLSDAQLRVRLGAQGRCRYEADFTLERAVANTLSVYQDVLTSTNARTGLGRSRPSPSHEAGDLRRIGA